MYVYIGQCAAVRWGEVGRSLSLFPPHRQPSSFWFWFLVFGFWFLGSGLCFMVHLLWFMMYGFWFLV